MSISSALRAYTFVIPADKALPSNDHCSHIFFENMWMIAAAIWCAFLGRPGRRWTSAPCIVGYVKPTPIGSGGTASESKASQQLFANGCFPVD